MQFHFIVIAERHRDAALRVFRRGFAESVLGDDQHRPACGQFDGRAQSRHSGADHQEVWIHLADSILTTGARTEPGTCAARRRPVEERRDAQVPGMILQASGGIRGNLARPGRVVRSISLG